MKRTFRRMSYRTSPNSERATFRVRVSSVASFDQLVVAGGAANLGNVTLAVDFAGLTGAVDPPLHPRRHRVGGAPGEHLQRAGERGEGRDRGRDRLGRVLRVRGGRRRLPHPDPGAGHGPRARGGRVGRGRAGAPTALDPSGRWFRRVGGLNWPGVGGVGPVARRVARSGGSGGPATTPDEAVGATYGDGDPDLLFRPAMQGQVIDDALDYPCDRAAGPPGSLTACESLPRAQELTRPAARGHAADRLAARPADVWPLRVALVLVSALAGLALSLRRLRSCRTSDRMSEEVAAAFRPPRLRGG